MLEICDIIIRISSESTALTTTPRSNVTPTEIAILRQAKGVNAIFYNGNLRRVNRKPSTEIARLQQTHGEAFTLLFPGVSPVIPMTFDAIGLDTSVKFEGEPYVPHPDDAQREEEIIEVIADPVPQPQSPAAPKKNKPTAKSNKQREQFD